MRRITSALVVALLGALATSANSATLVARSCSQTDVSSAVAIALDGDTVVIPSGTCTWNGPLSFSKAISILGSGVDSTNITNAAFVVSVPSGKPWRVSGMTVRGTGGFNVSSTSKSWRIDHIKFDRVSGFAYNRIIWIQPSSDYTSGVIDNTVFNDPQSIQVHYRGPSSDGGNGSYMRALGLGGPDAVYIEDSQFNHSVLEVSNPVTDCEGGGRLVVRYNSIKNSYTEMHDAIIGGLRSCRKWETYGNTFETTYASGQCGYIGIRGGTGVVFDNVFKNKNDCDPILLALYRTYQTGGNPWNALCARNSGKACLGSTGRYPTGCSTDGDCGGSSGSCIAIDGPSPVLDGYPCRDQVGVDGNAGQTSRPALFWNNRYATGAYVNPVVDSGASYIKADRDFCQGTTSMPAVCNGIPTTYTPYTYPHPLRQGTTPLPAPGNLRVP